MWVQETLVISVMVCMQKKENAQERLKIQMKVHRKYIRTSNLENKHIVCKGDL